MIGYFILFCSRQEIYLAVLISLKTISHLVSTMMSSSPNQASNQRVNLINN